MAAIQSRFEVAVPELPDHIDPASYSKFFVFLQKRDGTNQFIFASDFLIFFCHNFSLLSVILKQLPLISFLES